MARERIESLDPDVFVGTEVTLGAMPRGGHMIDAGRNWGSPVTDKTRRKVAMWSCSPWSDVAFDPVPGLPEGRCVVGRTGVATVEATFVGVCIPWDGAHVSTGRRDRRRWEDHEAFLAALPALLAPLQRPLILAGDFNQRMPRGRQPLRAFDALQRAIDGLLVPTAGATSHGPLIDHVAHSPDLGSAEIAVIDRGGPNGPLSDHLGVLVQFDARGA